MQIILAKAAPPHDDLRRSLRKGTRAGHDRLDAALGALDLTQPSGLTTFLAAHAFGLHGVLPAAGTFVETELGATMPDLAALVARDLAGLGVDIAPRLAGDMGLDALPDLDASAGAGAGMAYVVMGSRLGMAVLRRRGYWRSPALPACRYIEDTSVSPLWPRLLDWLACAGSGVAEPALAGARAGFAAFERGVAMARGGDELPGGGVPR